MRIARDPARCRWVGYDSYRVCPGAADPDLVKFAGVAPIPSREVPMTRFRGTYTVMITPFSPDGGVNVAALRQFVEWQIAEGIHGLIPLGSTGEFLSLSDTERNSCCNSDRSGRGACPGSRRHRCRGHARGRAAQPSSRDARRRWRDDHPAVLFEPTDAEIVHHYSTVADAIGLPIMIYNNPAVANVDLRPPLIARLAEIDNCRYIKDSTIDVTRVRDIIRLCGDRIGVFGGILGFESFVEGAVGWTAVAANIVPGPLARLFELVVDPRTWPRRARCICAICR